MLVEHLAEQAPQNPVPVMENAFVAHYEAGHKPAPKPFAQKVKEWLAGAHKAPVEAWAF